MASPFITKRYRAPSSFGSCRVDSDIQIAALKFLRYDWMICKPQVRVREMYQQDFPNRLIRIGGSKH